MEIRPAVPEDAAALSRIARSAKAQWGYPEEWLQQWSASLTITPEYIAQQRVFVAHTGSEPAGFAGLLVEGGAVQLDHLWVQPAWWGRGVGRSLFEHATKIARDLGFRALQIESDPHAEGFYTRMGAVVIGRVDASPFNTRRSLPVLSFDLTQPPRQSPS